MPPKLSPSPPKERRQKKKEQQAKRRRPKKGKHDGSEVITRSLRFVFEASVVVSAVFVCLLVVVSVVTGIVGCFGVDVSVVLLLLTFLPFEL